MVEHTRTLDFKIAFAIGLGTMIAAGIFSLSGTAVAAIGSSAVIAFVIAAVIAGITAAAYSEFASIYSENGGGYLFCSRTFEEQDLLTYGIGMSLFLGYTGTTAFYLATMDHWVFRFVLPESLHFLPHGSAGVATAILLGVLNARGTEESGTFQLLVTGAKVAVLIAFIAGAFAYAGPTGAISTFGGDFQFEPVNILSISALAFITFFGFSAIAASAGEIIKPRKTVPMAIAASIGTVTVLYTLVIVAMTNSPVSMDIIAEQGETAMGTVAAAFLGDIGVALIVAGAIFSMVSASNASILAASGIGSLMGRRGQAPRPFSRLHPDYGTPFWSIWTAIGTIVLLIVAFLTIFPAEGSALAGLHLGLEPLTGFATLNLLLPLAVVNVTLIYSRRRFPDITRGFRVPGVPVVPIIGVLANLGLIYNLPFDGVITGLVLTASLVVAYLAWGGRPAVDEIVDQIVETQYEASTLATGESKEPAAAATDRYSVLVPVARPERAPRYVRLAAALGAAKDEDPLIQVVTITELPDQTPNELVTDTAAKRTERISEELAATIEDAEYTVEGHICREIGFDIVQTARDRQSNMIVMGYAEERPDLAETVESKAPCDVVFAGPLADVDELESITVGVGGGPHQQALLSLVDGLARRGTEINLVNVEPEGGGGTPENPGETLSELPNIDEIRLHNVRAASVADGLVDAAVDNGGALLIGASRDRRLKRAVFGSTPDRVVKLSEPSGVPVLVYSSPRSVTGRLEELLFPVYRYALRLRRSQRETRSKPGEPSET